MKVLEKRLNFYFPAQSYAEFDWVLAPWSSAGLESLKGMPLQVQEYLTDLREDRSLKIKFQDMALDNFLDNCGERISSCCSSDALFHNLFVRTVLF